MPGTCLCTAIVIASDDHFTSLQRNTRPAAAAATLGSTVPFTGGRSWNMKSHFHRSDGFDACSQCCAATGRANVSVGSPA